MKTFKMLKLYHNISPSVFIPNIDAIKVKILMVDIRKNIEFREKAISLGAEKDILCRENVYLKNGVKIEIYSRYYTKDVVGFFMRTLKDEEEYDVIQNGLTLSEEDVAYIENSISKVNEGSRYVLKAAAQMCELIVGENIVLASFSDSEAA